MSTLTNDTKLLSIATLLLIPLSFYLDLTLFSVLLLSTLGMYHGALDIEIIGHSFSTKRQKALVLIGYIAIAMALFAAFLFHKDLFALVFIIQALGHFGYGDSLHQGKSAFFEMALRGLLPFCLASFFSFNETLAYYQFLFGSAGLYWTEAFAQISWTLAPLTLLALYNSPKKLILFLELALITALFALLQPLTAFTIYFICLHSMRHILSENLSLTSIPAWVIVALIFIPSLYLYFHPQTLFFNLYPIIAFGCLTLPHALLSFFKKNVLLNFM